MSRYISLSCIRNINGSLRYMIWYNNRTFVWVFWQVISVTPLKLHIWYHSDWNKSTYCHNMWVTTRKYYVRTKRCRYLNETILYRFKKVTCFILIKLLIIKVINVCFSISVLNLITLVLFHCQKGKSNTKHWHKNESTLLL